MVDILPLRGLCYSVSHASGTVYSPPYDVIDSAQRRSYLEQNRYNVVRLTTGPSAEDDTWYAEAAATMDRWISKGVLVRDRRPVFYGYEQRFRLPGGEPRVRRGFMGRIKLHGWGKGIHRHEHTQVAACADRLRLMRAMRTNMSPVFGIYRDPNDELGQWLRSPEQPLVDFQDAGVRHLFWRIEDEQAISALVRSMVDQDVIIADGHHRYKTALAYRDERHKLEGETHKPQPYDYGLAYLTAAEDPGLSILATHRVIANVRDLRGLGDLGDLGHELLKALSADFDVQPFDGPGSLANAVSAAAQEGVAIGACLGDAGTWVLKLKSLDSLRRATGGRIPRELIGLDVVVLQEMILQAHLGISPDVLSSGKRVTYTIDEQQARSKVASGQAQAAFILNPTTVDQVWQAASHGITLPQKSTYFYPKLLTGLVFNPLDEA